ncbi:MAG TPA: energy transducer TonB [Longimicrobiaceae bacterium]|nr:energy transducer TonB [Longimicrobiaceae bacterium]
MTHLTRIALAFSAAALAARPAHAQTAPAAGSARVWDAAEVTRQPQLINERAVARRVSHGYPKQLLDFGVHGRALLQLTVGADGRVEEVAGVGATHAPFATVAQGWARAMHFAPATVGGTPVRCRVLVPVDFAVADG